MDFSELLRILRATVVGHRRAILQLCLWSTLAAVAVSFVVPERYEATALVLVRPQENIGLGPTTTDKEMLDLPAGGTLQSDTPSKTYIEVIKSRAVAESVVRTLALDRKQMPPEDPTLADRLKGVVKGVVSGVRDLAKYGRLVDVSPFERAVRRLMRDLSLTDVRDTFVFRITYASSDPDEAAAVANAAAATFVELSTGANESEARTSREFVGRQLAATESELAAARQALREFKETHRSVALEEERTERIRSVGALETSLSDADAELRGLLGRFTAANPSVRAARARRDALAAAVAAEREQLRSFPDQEAQLARLALDVRTLESNYELLRKHHEEARLRESRRAAEIRVVSPAAVPVYPAAPIKFQYAGAAFALALIVGIGAALAAELASARLRSVADVERALGLSVLATAPRARE